MSEVRLAAKSRTHFGKGAARQIRREHEVPAVMYGHGQDPIHLSLPGHATMMALKTPNVLLSIDLNGKAQLAIPKEVQRHPIKGELEHVDLLMVRRGEKVDVAVPVVVEGDAQPGSVLTHELTELEVKAEATNIPEHFVVDVSGKAVGEHVTAADVVLPKGVELVTDAEAVVISIAAQQSAEALEADLAAAEQQLGVTHDEKDSEATDKSDKDAKA